MCFCAVASEVSDDVWAQKDQCTCEDRWATQEAANARLSSPSKKFVASCGRRHTTSNAKPRKLKNTCHSTGKESDASPMNTPRRKPWSTIALEHWGKPCEMRPKPHTHTHTFCPTCCSLFSLFCHYAPFAVHCALSLAPSQRLYTQRTRSVSGARSGSSSVSALGRALRGICVSTLFALPLSLRCVFSGLSLSALCSLSLRNPLVASLFLSARRRTALCAVVCSALCPAQDFSPCFSLLKFVHQNFIIRGLKN